MVGGGYLMQLSLGIENGRNNADVVSCSEWKSCALSRMSYMTDEKYNYSTCLNCCLNKMYDQRNLDVLLSTRIIVAIVCCVRQNTC